jgi:dipeptidase E
MRKIVVIGGGEIGRPGFPVETTKLDRETIRLSGKSHPRLLFLPTASSDSEGYVDVVKKHFGGRLRCKVDSLMLLNARYSKGELAERVLGADIIYVGGGNTLKMMRRWRHLGVDKLIKRAYNRGTVLSGLSAGGICWFDSGHSDSVSFYSPKSWDYINVKGMGLIKGIHCPHFDGHTANKGRRKDFTEFMMRYGEIGIAIDNKCAIEFVDDTYRVFAVNKSANAYRVFRDEGDVKVEVLKKTREMLPLEELYEKGKK